MRCNRVGNDQLDVDLVGTELLEHARTEAGDSRLRFAVAPERLDPGADTQVFVFTLSAAPDHLTGPMVLRIFREPGGDERERIEATTQTALVDSGYPAPQVAFVGGGRKIGGRSFMVMERLPGRSATRTLSFFSSTLFRLPGLMANAHASLHDVPGERVRLALDDAGVSLNPLTQEGRLESIKWQLDRSGLTALIPGYEWILANIPATSGVQVVCHQDFHPSNVMLDRGKLSGVIDWAKIAFGEREWDVALTTLFLDLGGVGAPGYRWALKRAYLHWVARRYRKAYARRVAIDHTKLRFYEAFHCFGTLLRASILRTDGVDSVVRPIHVHDWDNVMIAQAVTARFERITGIKVPPPPGV